MSQVDHYTNCVNEDNDLSDSATSFYQFAQDVLAIMRNGHLEFCQQAIRRTVFAGSSVREEDFTELQMHEIEPVPITEFVELPTAIRCVQIHLSNNYFTIRKPPDWPKELDPDYVLPVPKVEDYYSALIQRLLFPIYEAITKTKSLTPSKQTLLESYDRFIAGLTKQPYLRRFLAPLYGLKSDLESISLGDDWEIVRFTDDMKTTLWDASGRVTQPFEGHVTLSEYRSTAYCFCAVAKVIESKALITSGYLWDKSDAKRIVDNLKRFMLALRLVCEGHAGAPVIVSCPNDLSHLSGMQFNYPGLEAANWLFEPLTLKEENLQDIRQVYDNLRQVEQRNDVKWFNMAVHNFVFAYTCHHDKDRVLNLVIALENLLGNDSRNKRGKKVKTRGPLLLEHLIDQSEMKSFLNTMVDARNAIAHEGLSLRDVLASINEGLERHRRVFLVNCFTTARWMILTYLDWIMHGWTVEEVNALLDTKAISTK